MTMRAGVDFIATFRVRPDRAQDYEEWLRSVAMPATPPELATNLELLRADEPEDDGSVLFTVLFRGGSLADWELEPLLEKHYGADRAQTELQRLEGMLADDRPSSTWSLRSVDLGSGSPGAPE
jgi:hypothetical protein